MGRTRYPKVFAPQPNKREYWTVGTQTPLLSKAENVTFVEIYFKTQ
jgi:hypothetical protein